MYLPQVGATTSQHKKNSQCQELGTTRHRVRPTKAVATATYQCQPTNEHTATPLEKATKAGPPPYTSPHKTKEVTKTHEPRAVKAASRILPITTFSWRTLKCCMMALSWAIQDSTKKTNAKQCDSFKNHGNLRRAHTASPSISISTQRRQQQPPQRHTDTTTSCCETT